MVQDYFERRIRLYSVEFRMLCKDGSWKWIRARGMVVARDKDDKPIRMVGTHTDLTDRKKTEADMLDLKEKLRQSELLSALGHVVGGVAHEINNPLAYVSGNLELLDEALERMPPDQVQELRELVLDARSGTDRVRVIVGDLKLISRIDEDERNVVDVRLVLDATVKLAANEIRHRAQLVRDYADVALIDASESRVGQVFLNLVVNAAQAIPVGNASTNEIRLTTRTGANGEVVVEVKDSGAGIPPEVRGRVFEPFFTTKPVGEGTGLGLSICHGIVTALGGTLTVESEVGAGSTFRVVLPPSSRSASGTPAAPAPAHVAIRRGRVLVIDDEPGICRTLRRALSPEHDVTAMVDARAALALIQEVRAVVRGMTR